MRPAAFLTAFSLGTICLMLSAGAPRGSLVAVPLDSLPVYELANGRWFDGHRFVPRTLWSVSGRFADRRPARVDSVIDLTGRYIVPPFAEAHTHNIGCPPLESEAARYVRDGILYVLAQSGTYPRRTGAGDPRINVACASPPLTPRGSHLTVINERSADRGNFPGITRDQLDGRTHFVIESLADVERKLPDVLASAPALLKLILAFSEDFDRRATDSAFVGRRGLDPRLLPPIVRMAHEHRIRVAAHIETAADFRAAVREGVDLIAHLPGLRIGDAAGYPGDTTTSRWMLSAQDAEEAKARGVIVVTTLLASRALVTRGDPTGTATRAIHRWNLDLLLRHGVRLAIGSDFYQGTALTEAMLLGRQPIPGAGVEPLEALDNAAILRLWSMDTPRAIFPARRIGALRPGYEASLLALEGDPLVDLGNVRRITHRLKGGRLLP